MPNDDDIEEHLTKFQAANVKLCEKLSKNVQQAHAKQKEAYNKKINTKLPKITVGSKVLLSNIAIKGQKGKKLDHRYKGPMTVVNIDKNKFYLNDMEGKPLKNPVHKTRLKVYNEGNNSLKCKIF